MYVCVPQNGVSQLTFLGLDESMLFNAVQIHHKNTFQGHIVMKILGEGEKEGKEEEVEEEKRKRSR